MPALRALVLLVAVGMPTARADVLTVGPVGCDYTAIQPAVTAAVNGDVVLVRAGSYPQFAIDDKSVTVVAEAPGVVQITGQVRVQNLSGPRQVALIDLSVTGAAQNALLMVDNLGSVRVRGGTFRGTDLAEPWHDPRNAGLEASGCPDLALTGCVLIGGRGADAKLYPYIRGPAPGGDAIEARNCNLALDGRTLVGGDGGSDEIEEGYGGGNGGDGLELAGGLVFCADTSLQGGDGGAGGDEDGTPPFMIEAGDGGDGGHGLRLVGLQAPTHAELLSVQAAGGQGCPGGLGYWGPNGSPGTGGLGVVLIGQATRTDVPHTPRRLVAPGLWRGGQPVTLTFHGAPGESLFLTSSGRAAFRWLPARKGVLLLAGKPGILRLGKSGPTGTKSITLVPIDPPQEGLCLQLQAWTSNPQTGAHLTGPSTTALVDGSF